jgi:hypothetical protein
MAAFEKVEQRKNQWGGKIWLQCNFIVSNLDMHVAFMVSIKKIIPPSVHN